jgi:hypothetical protein
MTLAAGRELVESSDTDDNSGSDSGSDAAELNESFFNGNKILLPCLFLLPCSTNRVFQRFFISTLKAKNDKNNMLVAYSQRLIFFVTYE